MGDAIKKWERLSLLILATAFFYTTYRAFFISVSHDDALTFFFMRFSFASSFF